jgi:import inner membrane translocase subunit TIM21
MSYSTDFGGKNLVVRTTARMTNLTVILFGAGLSAVLVYALTTELFSKNSPTVLYTAACDKIKASSEVRVLSSAHIIGQT